MRNILLISLLTILFLLLVGIGALPSLASTHWGKRQIVQMVNRGGEKTLALEELSLSWFGSQKISGVQFTSPKVDLRCKQIETNASLIHILFGKSNLGQLLINEPEITLIQNTAPAVKKEESIRETSSDSSPTVPSVRGHVHIQRGKLSFQAPGVEPLALSDINMDADFPGERAMILNMGGKTEHLESAGRFHIKGTGAFSSLENFFCDLQAELIDFSVLGIDQMISLFQPQMRGLLAAAIGPTLNLDLDLKASDNHFEMSLESSAAGLNASLQTSSKKEAITLKDPAEISLILTPAFSQLLVKQFPSLTPFLLQKEGRADLKILSFYLPRNEKGLELGAMHFQSELKLSDLQFSQGMSFIDGQGRLQTKQLDEGIIFDWNGKFKEQDNLSSLALSGEIKGITENEIDGSFSLQGNDLPVSWFNPQLEKILGSKSTFLFRGDRLLFPWNHPEKMQLLGKLSFPSLILNPTLPLAHMDIHINMQSWEQVALHITEQGLDLSAELGWKNREGILSLKKPLTFQYRLNNEQLQALLGTQKAPTITPTALLGTIDPFSLPVQDFKLSSLLLKGTVAMEQLQVTAKDPNKQVILENLFSQIQINGKNGTASARLSAEIQDPNKKRGEITLHVAADHLLFGKECNTSQMILDGNLKLRDLSTTFLEPWIGQSLTPLLGPVSNMECKFHSSVESQTLSFKGSSEYLQIDMGLIAQDNQLRLSHAFKEDKILFTLSPEGYEMLDQWVFAQRKRPSVFRLDKPAQFSWTVSELSLPITTAPSPQTLAERLPRFQKDLTHLQLESAFEIDQFLLVDRKTGLTTALRDFDIEVKKTAGESPLILDLKGSALGSGSSKEKPIQARGKIDPQPPSAQLHVDIQQFPVAFLDSVARLLGKSESPPSAFIGPALNLQADLDIQNWTGALRINISAQNSRFSLNGRLDQGILTLNEPIYGQLLLTSELSTLILKEVNPLSLSAISAKNPITLEIDPQGFSVPIYPQNLAKLNISQATVELGQIVCANSGNINVALALLKAVNFSKDKDLKLWFTPMVLHIENGVLDCERTEILVGETYEIATWGKVDFVKQDVDMTLGLTSQCLKKAFGIKNLPPDYVLQIPMKGKMDDVEINTTLATAKIAALVAWQKRSLAGGIAGGLGGALIGEFLGVLGALPDKDTSYPAAKRPFPWDDGKTEAKKTSEKKKAINKEDKPLKQLMKIIR